jgi:hypothetical protein
MWNLYIIIRFNMARPLHLLNGNIPAFINMFRMGYMIKIGGLAGNFVLIKRLEWSNGYSIGWVSLRSTQPTELQDYFK